MEISQQNQRMQTFLSALYAILICALIMYLNYVMPYSSDPVTSPSLIQLCFWLLLYAPVIFSIVFEDWKMTDLGFTLGRRALIASLICFLICGSITQMINAPWYGALIEAFARTGEEVFVRGFLFLLLLKAFDGKSRPGIWATLASSLIFTLIHTQTFQSSYFEGDIETMWRALLILQRFFNIFLFAAVFGLLRYWTDSILPGAILHTVSKGGILALPFCLAIYGGILYWAYVRGERVWID